MDISNFLGAMAGTFLASVIVGVNVRAELVVLKAFCIKVADRLHLPRPGEPEAHENRP